MIHSRTLCDRHPSFQAGSAHFRTLREKGDRSRIHFELALHVFLIRTRPTVAEFVYPLRAFVPATHNEQHHDTLTVTASARSGIESLDCSMPFYFHLLCHWSPSCRSPFFLRSSLSTPWRCTTHHHPPPPTTTHHHPPPPTAIRHHPPPSGTVRHHSPPTTRHQPPPTTRLTTTHHYPPAPTTTTTHHHPPTTTTSNTTTGHVRVGAEKKSCKEGRRQSIAL